VKTYNLLVFVAAVVGAVAFLYAPNRIVIIVLAELVWSLGLWFVAMRPVPEPRRALVYRLATLHHIDGPGYVFLIPTLDSIQGFLDTSVHPLKFDVPQIKTLDGQAVRTNLEVTWRISPEVRGRVTGMVRRTVFMKEEHQASVVEEVVILIARQIVGNYTYADLGRPENREAAMATMAEGANEKLEPQGLQVERIFWRGSQFPAKLSEAQLQRAVEMEHVEGIIQAVEAVRKRLPDMQPEEFLALQAWLETFRRGGMGGPPPSPAG
jgi:hypothetical protein